MIEISNSARAWAAAFVFVVLGLASTSALSGELVVAVSGVERADGEVGCALYAVPTGFPMDPSTATRQWHAADLDGVECQFNDLAPGVYAVAVSQDFNGNRETDTNFFGIPTEPWGVSNNVRPTLRAPTFDEAAVRVAAQQPLRIIVEVAER